MKIYKIYIKPIHGNCDAESDADARHFRNHIKLLSRENKLLATGKAFETSKNASQ